MNRDIGLQVSPSYLTKYLILIRNTWHYQLKLSLVFTVQWICSDPLILNTLVRDFFHTFSHYAWRWCNAMESPYQHVRSLDFDWWIHAFDWLVNLERTTLKGRLLRAIDGLRTLQPTYVTEVFHFLAVYRVSVTDYQLAHFGVGSCGNPTTTRCQRFIDWPNYCDLRNVVTLISGIYSGGS